jgi:hypothetical protein
MPSIDLPGIPAGMIAVEICHGNRVRGRFELHGNKLTKGGRFAVSAVVVEPAPGYEFVQQTGGHYWVQKISDPLPEGAVIAALYPAE